MHLLWIIPTSLFLWAIVHGGTRKEQPSPVNQDDLT